MDELERVAASYLLRPRGSVCLSSGHPVDDNDDDRFADDGSVYIYREGDSSPSAEDRPQGSEKQEKEEGAEHGGRDSADHRNRRDLFTTQDVDEDDNLLHEYGSRRWQDERRREPTSARTREAGRSSSGYTWGESVGDLHRGAAVPCAENGPMPLQHGEGRGDVAAEVSSSEGEMGLEGWQHQEHRRVARPSGAQDLTKRKHMSSDGDAQRTQPGVGRASEPSSTHEWRTKKNDRSCLPAQDFGGEAPAEVFAIPVPGANYSAKIDRGLQRWGGRDTAFARGLGKGGDAGTPSEPNAKVRQAAARLRSMILDRQASANRSIREVFGHFDRRRCGYVNVAEMRDALADLRLHLSPDEGKVSKLQTTAMRSGPTVRLTVLCDTRQTFGTQLMHDMQLAVFFGRFNTFLFVASENQVRAIHLRLVC